MDYAINPIGYRSSPYEMMYAYGAYGRKQGAAVGADGAYYGVDGRQAANTRGETGLPETAAYRLDLSGQEEPDKPILNPGEDTKKMPGKKSSPAECETCANRKYQDGSDEMDVSFKAPGHIAPGAAAGTVMAHERQHVANAYQKASENNGVVERASVRLKTAVCPECGRSYVSGGETQTQIKYYNEDNPYQQDLIGFDAANKYRGMNVDLAA